MEGKYVRPLGYAYEEDDLSEHENDADAELIENDTENEPADEITSNFGKINPLALVDAFPEDPGLEEAREYWIDWIEMLKKLFKWNRQVDKSENMKLSKEWKFIRRCCRDH